MKRRNSRKTSRFRRSRGGTLIASDHDSDTEGSSSILHMRVYV